jgi:hypothetical protein
MFLIIQFGTGSFFLYLGIVGGQENAFAAQRLAADQQRTVMDTQRVSETRRVRWSEREGVRKRERERD